MTKVMRDVLEDLLVKPYSMWYTMVVLDYVLTLNILIKLLQVNVVVSSRSSNNSNRDSSSSRRRRQVVSLSTVTTRTVSKNVPTLTWVPRNKMKWSCDLSLHN